MNYTQRLAEANLVPSVGSVGDSYDNALAETINGLYKAEVIWRQRYWPNASAVWEPAHELGSRSSDDQGFWTGRLPRDAGDGAFLVLRGVRSRTRNRL
jgi:transposase InsO family protein